MTQDIKSINIESIKIDFDCKNVKLRGRVAGLLEAGVFPSRLIKIYNQYGKCILVCHDMDIREAVHTQRDRQYQEGSFDDLSRVPTYAAVLCEWKSGSEVDHSLSQVWLYQTDHINQYCIG